MGIPKGVKDPELSFELGRTALDLEGQSKMHQMALLEPSLKEYYQTPQYAQLSRDTPLLKVGVDLFSRGKIATLLPPLRAWCARRSCRSCTTASPASSTSSSRSRRRSAGPMRCSPDDQQSRTWPWAGCALATSDEADER